MPAMLPLVLAAALGVGARAPASAETDRRHASQVVAVATVRIVRAQRVSEKPEPGGVVRHVEHNPDAGVTIAFE